MADPWEINGNSLEIKKFQENTLKTRIFRGVPGLLGATWGLVKHVFSRGFCGSDQIPLENRSWERFCLHFTLWGVLLGAPG